MPKLTAKQARFIEEYLVDGNGKQAAIRAGYSKKSASVIARENLLKPYLKAALDEKRRQQSERTQITADKALRALDDLIDLPLGAVGDGTVYNMPADRRQSALGLLKHLPPEPSPGAGAAPGAVLPFIAFIRRYFADVFDRPLTAFHFEFAAWIEQSVETATDEERPAVQALFLNAFRGMGKSALAKAGIIWLLAYRRIVFPCVVSETLPLAQRHARSLKAMITNNQRLVQDFPSLSTSGETWDLDAASYQTSRRGVTFGEDLHRIDFILLTDLEDHTDTSDTKQKIIDNVAQNILPAGSEHGTTRVIFDQTRTHAESIMTDCLEGDPPFLQGAQTLAVRAALTDVRFSEDDKPQLVGGTPTVEGFTLEGEQAQHRLLGHYYYQRERLQDTKAGQAMAFWMLEEGLHVIDDFPIPADWLTMMGYDYGHNSPWSAQYVAYTDGNRTPNGLTYPPKTAFVFGSMTATPGHRLTPSQQAEKMKEYEKQLSADESRLMRVGDVNARYGASSYGGESLTVGAAFAEEGLLFQDANKEPGSRVDRANHLRSRLLASRRLDSGKPAIFFFRSVCGPLVEDLSVLRSDPDIDGDVLKSDRDHAAEALMYALHATPYSGRFEVVSEEGRY